MRILQVVPYFFPAWSYGGPGKLVYDTSKELARRGNAVAVFTSDAYDAQKRMSASLRLKEKNPRVTYFKNISNHLAFYSNIYLPFALFFVTPFTLGNFDVVHMHDFYTLSNIWICLWARIYQIPYIISVHGCLEQERLQQRTGLKRLFLTFFGSSMLQHAARVVATSENEVSAYLSYGIQKDRIVRLGHGVDESEFLSRKSKEACRKQLGLPKNAIIYTYLGRLHTIKGLDLLIQAFTSLQQKDTFLVIAGSDEGMLSDLVHAVATNNLTKRVKFFGPTSGRAKADLFKASDVFVYPSRSEGFSLGILEALAAGLPCILTTGCHFEEVSAVGAGLLCDVEAASVAKALHQFYALPPKNKLQMSKKARALIQKSFSLRAMGETLEKMYDQVLHSQH